MRLSLILALAVAGVARAAERPNVLWLISDDHAAYVTGCYGNTIVRTPHLDGLADEGLRLANAFVTYSVCSPSRSSILTGLYTHQNGQIGLATHKYAMYRHWPNIASLLKGAGYRTGIIGKLHVNPAEAFPFDFKALSGSNFNDRPMEKFADLADYQEKWKALMDDPRVLEIFETTGPMVKGESFKLLESVSFVKAP